MPRRSLPRVRTRTETPSDSTGPATAVCPRVLQDLVAQGKLPNLARQVAIMIIIKLQLQLQLQLLQL